MEPLAFGMGIRRNGNVTGGGAPCSCDGVELGDRGGVDLCAPGAQREGGGHTRGIQEKGAQRIGDARGMEALHTEGAGGREHRTWGLQGRWDAESGTGAAAQWPGNVLSMAPTPCCCWPRAPTTAGALQGTATIREILQVRRDLWDKGSLALPSPARLLNQLRALLRRSDLRTGSADLQLSPSWYLARSRAGGGTRTGGLVAAAPGTIGNSNAEMYRPRNRAGAQRPRRAHAAEWGPGGKIHSP